jgi:pyruvate-formate lyase-activating enzyme
MEQGRTHPGRFDLAEIEAQLDRALAFTREVLFTSGEPTLHRQLVLLVAAAAARGYEAIGLISNGRRLKDRALCTDLLDAGLNRMTFSIHGASAAVHDSITCRPGSFEQTRRGLANMAELRRDRDLALRVNCTLVQQNIGDMRAIWEFISGFEVDNLNFNIAEPRGWADKNFETVVLRWDLALDAADASGLDFSDPQVSLSRIPACAGSHEWIQEDFHFTQDEEVTHYDPTEGKVRGSICEECHLASRCSGIWKRYVEAYGWVGLRPVQAPLPMDTPPFVVDLTLEEAPGRQVRRAWLLGHRSICFDRPFRDKRLLHLVRLARTLGFQNVTARTDGYAIAKLSVMKQVAKLGLHGLGLFDINDPQTHKAMIAAHRVGLYTFDA